MSTQDSNSDRWPELRTLLIGPERDRLDAVEKRLNDPDILADEISRVLPTAVTSSSKKDDTLVKAFSPVVERAVHESVKNNTKTFANVLYPVIRPAIQKAIASTFKKMVQSLNTVIENSFTLRGIRWRFQSLVTRKPFAEIVLIHSLLFSVEQVFLIRKESGILLHQVQSGLDISKDGDLVSAMLKAIQDFVIDSFKMDADEEGLETIQVGDFSIWIEQGEYVILAGVIRGNAPEEIRGLLKDALEKIEHQYRDGLEAFNGDTSVFEEAGYLMAPCLKTEVKDRKRRIPLLSWLLLVFLVIYAAYAGWSRWDAGNKWERYIRQVEAMPGMIITHREQKGGKYIINGLRDQLSPDPAELLVYSGLDPEDVVADWHYYHSLAPKYILARTRRILNPPPTVHLSFRDGTVYAYGNAAGQWIKDVTILARSIPDISGLEQSGLLNRDETRLYALAQELESQQFYFPTAGDSLSPGQEEALEKFLQKVQTLTTAATGLGLRVTITVIGRTDATGTRDFNEKIGAARAEMFARMLIARGAARENILQQRAEQLNNGETSETMGNRVVTFKITVHGRQNQ